jgi:hypothetical protein
MALHDDAVAVDAAILDLERALATLRESTHAANREYRAAHHGHSDPVNEDIGRYVRAAVAAQPTVAKLLGLTRGKPFRLADVWRE